MGTGRRAALAICALGLAASAWGGGDSRWRALVRGKPRPDYLKLVRDYAECMLRFGRDDERYGPRTSPLFASVLTRQPQPSLFPPPEFFPDGRDGWLLHEFKNIPSGLGGEKASKETVVGADPMCDQDMYQALFLLSDLTGNGKYRRAAEAALDWWFRNTQSPVTGLYPWGEHMGWDFRNDAPSYATGPLSTLFSRRMHEPRGTYALWDYCARIPPLGERGRWRPEWQRWGFKPEQLAELKKLGAWKWQYRPIERYALGMWERHWSDKQRGAFSRHADYYGWEHDDGAFLRIMNWIFHWWGQAYATSTNPRFIREMNAILDQAMTTFEARQKKAGFIYGWDCKDVFGRAGSRENKSFNQRMIQGMLYCARLIYPKNPAMATRICEFCVREMNYAGLIPDAFLFWLTKDPKYDPWRGNKPGDTAEPSHSALKYCGQDIGKKAEKAPSYSWPVAALLEAYAQTGQRRFLDSADEMSHTLMAMFLEPDVSPLPKARSATYVTTPDGKKWRMSYHAGAGCCMLVRHWVTVAALKKLARYAKTRKVFIGYPTGPQYREPSRWVIHLFPTAAARPEEPTGRAENLPAPYTGVTIQSLEWDNARRRGTLVLRSDEAQTLALAAGEGIASLEAEGAATRPFRLLPGAFEIDLPPDERPVTARFEWAAHSRN